MTSEEEVELAVLHVKQSVNNYENSLEFRELRKKVSESFGSVKKMVFKFKSAAIFFIGIDINPLNKDEGVSN